MYHSSQGFYFKEEREGVMAFGVTQVLLFIEAHDSEVCNILNLKSYWKLPNITKYSGGLRLGFCKLC